MRWIEKNRHLKRLRGQVKKSREHAEAQAITDESATGVPVFFVVGRAKSGTSWLMRTFNAHPEILCKGEGRFFGRDFIREDFKAEEGGRIQPSSLYRAFLEADYLRAWIERSVWSRGDDPEEHLKNLTRLTTEYFLNEKLAKSGKKIVGDKTPLLGVDILKETAAIYPEAKVIHIIRDGRDTAVSLRHHRWNRARDTGGIYELDPEELERREAFRNGGGELTKQGLFTEKEIRSYAAGWREQISHTREDGRTLLVDNYAEVKYEDLLERPVEETRRLLMFLSADASREIVERCVEASSFERWTEGRQRGEEDPSSFFRKGVAGDWKNVFTERDKEIYKEEAGELLISLGYEKDYSW